MNKPQTLITIDKPSILALGLKLKDSFKDDKKEIEHYQISLDKDPTSKSPSQLYLKLHEANQHTNRIGVLYSKYLQTYLSSKKILAMQEEFLKKKVKAAMHNEYADAVKSMRGYDEKYNYVESQFSEDIDLLNEVKAFQFDATTAYQFFKVRMDLIKEAKGGILTQLGIIKAMMGLGELKVLNPQVYTASETYDNNTHENYNTKVEGDEGAVQF